MLRVEEKRKQEKRVMNRVPFGRLLFITLSLGRFYKLALSYMISICAIDSIFERTSIAGYVSE